MAKGGGPVASGEDGTVVPLIKPRESARLTWNSKPRREPNPRDLEFQPAEVVFANRAVSQTEQLVPRTPEGEVDNSKLNRLIWGDNLLVMQALLSQGYGGKVRLIYIDPPFLSSSDYSHRISIKGRHDVVKAPSLIERLAYRDTWQDGIDSYLDMLYPRLQLMQRLLTEDGSIFVHMDWHMGHYVRVLLDEIFGKNNFLNEIVWYYYNKFQGNVNHFACNHDTIFWYKNRTSAKHVFHQLKEKRAEGVVRQIKRGWDSETGKLVNLKDENGHVLYQETDEKTIDDVWRISMLQPADRTENLFFETQKPERVLERILRSASDESDIVADFFCGSGTTPAVAERLGRRWIAADLSKTAVQVSRSRLVASNSSPFVIENIGNYQRELIYKEGGNIALMQRIVMKLYGAQPHIAHTDLGILDSSGKKILVYVGYPDRPLTAKKTAELVKIARTLDGEGYDKLVLLAWDYEYNYDEGIEVRRKGFGVQVEPRLIPPSIYEYLRKSKNEDDLIERFADKIQFGAKPYLKITAPKVTDRGGGEHNVVVSIERYVLSEVPVEDEKDRIELQKLSTGDGFSALIDYWAVDWDYDGKTFRSRWQDFRSDEKDGRLITTRANITLNESRRFDIAVRVVDVFGNDATATTSVDLR